MAATNLTSLALRGGLAIGAYGSENYGTAGQVLVSGGGENSAMSWSSSPSIAGPMLLGAGTAAAPSYSFSSDPDTGMFSAGSNSLSFAVGGSTLLNLSNSNAQFSGTATATSFISGSANPASAGVVRLAYLDTVKFRNSNNNGDLSLVQSSTDGILTYNGDDIVLRTLAQTLTNKTLTTPTISGVTDGSSASAGNVGEAQLITTVRASAVSLSTSTAANVASCSLLAGDYDISGISSFLPGASTTFTDILWGLSKTSATLSGPTGTVDSTGQCTLRQGYPAGNTNGGIDLSFTLPRVRVSLSSTTILYLVAQANFGISTMKAYGNIIIRRVR
jgi:hypothetical protein